LAALGDWFLDTDLDSDEKRLITGQILLSVAVLVLNYRLIVAPPPFLQGLILVLPAPIWFALLCSLSVCHVFARLRIDFKARQRCAAASGFCCFALCGPLSSRAPTFLIIVVPFALAQLTLALRLKRLAKADADAEFLAVKGANSCD
jgi:O-antigen/teichoic acid export membrane protein